jgi:cellulose synthase operon protein C
MERIDLELPQEPGAELALRYRFRVPRFARVEGKQLVLGPLTYPALLGRRFLQLGSRKLPLFIDEADRSRARVNLKLPAGFALNGPVAEAKLPSEFGSYLRREQQQGNVLHIEEQYELRMGRIPPARYDDFAHFAGQVDLLQGRDLVLERKPGREARRERVVNPYPCWRIPTAWRRDDRNRRRRISRDSSTAI